MALSIVKLLSVALTYTLATRILTLEEPASNRTKQPMRPGCWGRHYWSAGLKAPYYIDPLPYLRRPAPPKDRCRLIGTYAECNQHYVFHEDYNKFGACHWWRDPLFNTTVCSIDGAMSNAMNMAAQMQPDECDPEFIQEDIPGGYAQFYKDGCVATLCGRANFMAENHYSPWPRDYSMWFKFWAPMANMWGWAETFERKCIVPHVPFEWTRVVWREEIFVDKVYYNGTDVNWDTSQCPKQTEWTDTRLP